MEDAILKMTLTDREASETVLVCATVEVFRQADGSFVSYAYDGNVSPPNTPMIRCYAKRIGDACHWQIVDNHYDWVGHSYWMDRSRSTFDGNWYPAKEILNFMEHAARVGLWAVPRKEWSGWAGLV